MAAAGRAGLGGIGAKSRDFSGEDGDWIPPWISTVRSEQEEGSAGWGSRSDNIPPLFPAPNGRRATAMRN